MQTRPCYDRPKNPSQCWPIAYAVPHCDVSHILSNRLLFPLAATADPDTFAIHSWPPVNAYNKMKFALFCTWWLLTRNILFVKKHFITSKTCSSNFGHNIYLWNITSGNSLGVLVTWMPPTSIIFGTY